MNTPDPDPNQDLIDMIATNRTEPTANEAHRESLREQVLAAYDQRDRDGAADTANDSEPPRNPLFTFTGGTVMKIAASLALLTVIGIFTVTALTPSKAIAFEDVARAILKIENASFEIHSTIRYADGKTEDEGTHKVVTKLPNLLRAEMEQGEAVIVDFDKNKMLMLNPEEKVALVMDDMVDFDEEDGMQRNFFGEIQEHLRNAEKGGDFGEIKYEKLGEKKINGVPAVGFRVLNPDASEADLDNEAFFFNILDIWADAKTGGPVYLEFTMDLEDGNQVKSTFENFVYNQKLDRKLFSFEAPEGYELLDPTKLADLMRAGRVFKEELDEAEKEADKIEKEVEDNVGAIVEKLRKNQPTQDDVINALRAYAKHTDGKLPETMVSGPMIDEMLEAWEKANPGKELFSDGDDISFKDQELDKDYEVIVRAGSYLYRLDMTGGKYTYRGKGVTVDDKRTPVLWLQSKGASAYTVIYNDFSTRDTNQGPDDQ